MRLLGRVKNKEREEGVVEVKDSTETPIHKGMGFLRTK